MDRLDTATSIRVLDADNAEVKGYRFAVLFSPETLFEELGAIAVFRQGRQSYLRQAARDRNRLGAFSPIRSA